MTYPEVIEAKMFRPFFCVLLILLAPPFTGRAEALALADISR